MRVPLAWLALAAVMHPGLAEAQLGERFAFGVAPPGPSALAASDTSLAWTAAPVRVEARPPSFEVVAVAVPDQLRAVHTLTYAVHTAGAVRLLGSPSGRIRSESSGAAAPLLITLQVPALRQAGSNEVARVTFEASDGRRVDVPVEVVVPLMRAIEVDVLDVPGGVDPGGEVVVTYAVRNTGNADEVVVVEALAPRGWDARSGARERFALAAGERSVGRMVFRVQRSATPRGYALDLVATVGGAPVASARARVEVLAEQGQGASPGPVLTAGLMHATGRWGDHQLGTLRLEGPLTPSVRVSGELSTDGLDHRGAPLGMSRLGFGIVRPHLDLRASSWQAQIGSASQRLPDVAGAHVGGRGISASVQDSAWQVSALLARPSYLGNSGDQEHGVVGAARFTVDRGPVLVSASAARLEDHRFDGSELDAFGLGLEMPDLAGGRLGADLAHRRFQTGSGLGVGLHFERRGEASDIRARWNHAPGGRTAFARATDEVDLSVGYALHERVQVRGNYRGSRDNDTGRFGDLATLGSAVGARVRLTDGVGVSFGGRLQRLDASTDAGRLATDEVGIDGGVDLSSGRVSAGLDALATTRRRETVTPTGNPFVEEGRRLSVRGRVMARGRLGSYGVNGSFTRSDRGAGAMPRDVHVSLRGTAIPLLTLGPTTLTGDVDVGHAFGYGPLGSRTTVRAGLDATLGSSAVRLAVARDPYLGAWSGASPWSVGVRVERSVSLPPIHADETKGLVFRDLDGNGERDPGEPGAAGVVVRSGGRSAVSDEYGVFRLAGPTAAVITVDARSLPAGWVAGPVTARDGRPVVALTSLSPVRVALALESDAIRRLDDTELERVTVVARHESGRAWVARRESATAAVFDALPPGRYRLDVIVDDGGEPLQLVGEPPEIEVRDGGGSRDIVITFRARQISIRKLEGGSR